MDKETVMNDEDTQFVYELLAVLPDELRETFEEAARLDGLTLEEYVLTLLSDMDREGLLEPAIDGDVPEDEFLKLVFVGDCPKCGSDDTVCCDEMEGIDDPTVASCNQCGHLWCLECGLEVARGEICGHWDVCDSCDEEKDEYEECGIMPSDCPRIIEWIARNYAQSVQGTCAWCGSQIPESGEVYAVGATLKGGIQFQSGSGTTGFFMPIAIGGRMVPAIVTAPGSDARQQGNDLMFVTCSDACARELRDSLCEEKELVERAEQN